MKLFQSARLTLTAWYLLIIMCITILFSMVLYRALTYELDRFQQRQIYQLENPTGSYILPPREYQMRQEFAAWSIQAVIDAKQRVFFLLAGINGGILLIAGGLGYILAGRTLLPIKKMVDDQQRFITDASHELRTPLTALKSEIEVGLRDNKLSMKDVRILLESNLEEVNNLTQLSNNLLELTHYQNTKTNKLYEQIPVDAILQDAIKRTQGLAKKKKIQVEKEIIATKIHGYKEQLTEVFVILLDNAIKYSSAKTMITIFGSTSGKHLKIHIKDQGIGISEADMPYVFDRFYRSNSSRSTTTISGYGLGLSIAKKIVEEHNGKIQVQSKLGHGSTFIVYFPVSNT